MQMDTKIMDIQEQIKQLRLQQEVTKGMEWYRLEEEIQELLDEE